MVTLFKDLAIGDTFTATPKHQYLKLVARTYTKEDAHTARCADDGIQYYFPSETQVVVDEDHIRQPRRRASRT